MSTKDVSWAARLEKVAGNARFASRGELATIGEMAREMAEPAGEIAEASGEITAALEILEEGSGYDRDDKEAARRNLRDAAGKLAAALREMDGLMSW